MDRGKKITFDDAAFTTLLPDGDAQFRPKSPEVTVCGSLAHVTQAGYFLYHQAFGVLIEEVLHLEQACRPVCFTNSINLIQFGSQPPPVFCLLQIRWPGLYLKHFPAIVFPAFDRRCWVIQGSQILKAVYVKIRASLSKGSLMGRAYRLI